MRYWQTVPIIIALSLTTIAVLAQDEQPDPVQQLVEVSDQLDLAQQSLARSAYLLSTAEEKNAFFEDAVRPILERRCIKCHGEEKQKGELRLDNRAAALEGGETFEAIVPGDPEDSLLVIAIRHDEKPKMPKDEKLPQGEIDLLTAWIEIGAPWPEEISQPTPTEPAIEKDPARAVPAVTLAIDPGQTVSFDREVLPILSDHCFACHGPDANTREAGLRLDLEATAYAPLASGRRAIVPGSLEESQVIQRLAAHDPVDIMPPADFEKPVSDEQIETIARWILQGARWESHWAFEEPERLTPSEPAPNPIDAFVLGKLNERGLEMNPEADRRTLIRRATLDLTGLPPTPEEIDAFLQDDRPDAYEHLLDRLLASPHYGEHMARYWLDAARYSDTNGYHIDNERHMWRWRDWIINAYNDNKPFDDFTIEQLAGDLLENPTQEQLIATGFNRNHMINFEGGAIPEEYRVQYVIDRVNTTSTVWLGLTMACAQCHSHKYDPITQTDFYRMFAFFNTVDEKGLDGKDTGNAQPVIMAPLPRQEKRLDELRHAIDTARKELYQPDPELDSASERWQEDWHDRLSKRWTPLKPLHAGSTSGSELAIHEDASVLPAGNAPDTDTYEIEYTLPDGRITALQLEAIPDPTIQDRIGRAHNGNFILTEFEAEIATADNPDQYTRVNFARALVDIEQPEFPVTKAIDGDANSGWAPHGHGPKGDRLAVFIPSSPIDATSGAKLKIRLKHDNAQVTQHLMGRFRISTTSDPALSRTQRNPWRVAGPFIAETKDDARDKAFVDIKNVDPNATYPDGRAKWNQLVPPLAKNAVRTLEGGRSATYLHRTINAPTARTLTAKIGTQEAVEVWVNGVSVFKSEDKELLRKNEGTFAIPLREGSNDIVTRITNFRRDATIYFDIINEPIGHLPYAITAALTRDPENRSDDQRAALTRHFRSQNWDQWAPLSAKLTTLEQDFADLEQQIPITMVMGEMNKPRDTFILMRGQYDQPTEKVSADTPEFLGPMPDDLPRNRLGLAKWLVSDNNPLTARVTVNRIWARLFGKGLVETAEDFGKQGRRPTHPALLDWLALEFVDSGWDLKNIQKTIMTSKTYRQSSAVSPDKFAKDTNNRYLSRASRFRLDAEVIRDSALTMSGLLNDDTGGKSVLPYQPPGLWQEVGYGGNFTAQIFKQDHGGDLYRRSMYTFWKRTSPPPSMMIFDAPNREVCTVQRSRSNTPLQALTLMNDPQFVEAARKFAERVLKEGGKSTDERLTFAFETATAREPSSDEHNILHDILIEQRAEFAEGDAHLGLLQVGDSPYDESIDARELASWSVITSIILNLDETITRS